MSTTCETEPMVDVPRCPQRTCDAFIGVGQVACEPHWKTVTELTRYAVADAYANRSVEQVRAAIKAALVEMNAAG
jgi:hypothetical protein